MSGKTYSEDELKAAIEEATAPLAARLVQLQAAAQESEVEGRIAAMKAEADAEIEEVRAQLDSAVLAREAAVSELAEFKAGLEELAAAQEQAAAQEARREERLARVREVASFSDEYIELNADRWVALSDEDFEARMSEWASLVPSKGDSIPKHTALTAARESTDRSGMGAIRDVLSLRMEHVDPRKI